MIVFVFTDNINYNTIKLYHVNINTTNTLSEKVQNGNTKFLPKAITDILPFKRFLLLYSKINFEWQ